MSQLLVPISLGELIDKITILEIKSRRIRDTAKLEHVRKELALLTDVWNASPHAAADITEQRAQLNEVNETLWDIEDQIRQKEADGQFDGAFIELARRVYLNNDERAAIKHRINTMLASDIVEEKSYAGDMPKPPHAKAPTDRTPPAHRA